MGYGQPTTMKLPIAAAFALGAVLAKLFLVRDPALPKPKLVEPQEECGPTRHERTHGDKELLVGQRATLRTGSMSGILERTENGTVILSFANSQYTASLVNWLALMTNLDIRNYAIVCLDTALVAWLGERKSRCQYLLSNWKHGVWSEQVDRTCQAPGAQSTSEGTLAACKMSCERDVDCRAIAWNKMSYTCYHCAQGYTSQQSASTDTFVKMTTETLWWARWKLLVRLLNANVHVLLADLDAMFLRNPLPLLMSFAANADIVAQRGTFPDYLSSKWGSALCMGFSYWRSTPATKRFTVPMTTVVEASGDDQVGINVALDRGKVTWDTPRLAYERATNVNYGTTRLGMRVAMLPHHQFPRKCDALSEHEVMRNAYVAHCFEPLKSGDAKMKIAQRYKLWVLREDWDRAVDPNNAASFDEYLRMVQAPTVSAAAAD